MLDSFSVHQCFFQPTSNFNKKALEVKALTFNYVFVNQCLSSFDNQMKVKLITILLLIYQFYF